MTAYYNENDPFAARWLRNLIDAGHIAQGEVDDRSISDVRPDELMGYTQCHFFAGIGGWSYALRLAGWPDDRPVWTGSCPCQPFSVAGKREGVDDERHLWPDWRWLIDQCRPATIFGEQVASKDGRMWLSGVRSDLETMGYEVGAADLCAASIGAPHIRQRLWFVANSSSKQAQRRESSGFHSRIAASGAMGGVGHGIKQGLERQSGAITIRDKPGRITQEQDRPVAKASSGGPWGEIKWIECADGKARPIKPGIKPLAHGVSGRLGRLRAYGNAIVPQVAAEFVAAYMGILTNENKP